MGDENHLSTTITWRIIGFTTLTETSYYSDMFVVVGTKWRIKLYPKGRMDHLSLYLEVAEHDTLPSGWKREARYSFTVVNQRNNNLSRTEEAEDTFTSQAINWGYSQFISLSELHDISGGFLVNDTLVVEAEVEVKCMHPPIISTGTLWVGATTSTMATNRFDAYFASLEGLIVGTSAVKKAESFTEENGMNSEIPSLEEVEQARQSLKECLTDLFKLNMKEKLAKALLTLSLSKNGLSSEEHKTIVSFWENFDEFTSDFIVFERENSEYELQKLLKDEILKAMEKNHKTHLSFKESHSELTKEGEAFKKRLVDIGSKLTKLTADWDSLLAESETLESNYKAQERKVADAEENKRIAEERMSRSTAAWSNLKKQFGCKEL